MRGFYRAALLLLFSAWGFAEPVKDVPAITLKFPDGSMGNGHIEKRARDLSIAPDGAPVTATDFVISYVVFGENGRIRVGEHPLKASDAKDVLALAQDFAAPNKTYAVARSTDGYSAGTANEIILTLKKDGELDRYSDHSGKTEAKLLPAFSGKDPLFALVNYVFYDADREKVDGKTDPHGRIEMSDRGEVKYTTYAKPVPVFEKRLDGGEKPRLAGEFPSISAALEAARRGDTTGLRFAADFGPQFSGLGYKGPPRENQLMPLIPLGQVTKPGSQEKLIVALAPDQLQAYRRGEITADRLLLIPPSALRYVSDKKDWGAVIDDYLELRATGREPARIFVANRKPSNGEEAPMTSSLNSIAIFGDGGAKEMEKSLNDLRSEVPKSILDLDIGEGSKKKKPSSSGCQFKELA